MKEKTYIVESKGLRGWLGRWDVKAKSRKDAIKEASNTRHSAGNYTWKEDMTGGKIWEAKHGWQGGLSAGGKRLPDIRADEIPKSSRKMRRL